MHECFADSEILNMYILLLTDPCLLCQREFMFQGYLDTNS